MIEGGAYSWRVLFDLHRRQLEAWRAGTPSATTIIRFHKDGVSAEIPKGMGRVQLKAAEPRVPISIYPSVGDLLKVSLSKLTNPGRSRLLPRVGS